MAVSVDVATELVRTDTSSPATWSHVGAGSGIKGILISAVHDQSNTDHVSAVTYGGVALTRVVRASTNTTEPGAAEWWFLGSSVPQGTQTASVTCGGTGDDFHFVSITLLGDGDLSVVDTDTINDAVQADPSVTLQYGGRSSMAFAANHSGANAALTPNANCSTVHTATLSGVRVASCIRQTTAGTSDFAIGGTLTSDDVAYAALAVTDVPAGSFDPLGAMGFFGV